MVDYSKAYVAVLALVTICTFKDLCVQTSQEKQIPITKVSLGTNLGPTLKFFYCYSCGYRKLFDDYANMIRQKYPEMSIEGGNYEPPGIQLLIAKTLGVGKMLVMLCIVSGLNVFAKVGVEAPAWWGWCLNNRIYSCLMIFFLSNAVEAHLVSTGAFEIVLNDMPVWSKLETGRIPQPTEVFQIIETHLKLKEPFDINSDFPK